MKKELALVICVLMLLSFVPSIYGGRNTLKVAEVLSDGDLDYTWSEHNSTDWAPYEINENLSVYRCSLDPGVSHTYWAYPAEGITTYRGLMTARVNVSEYNGVIPYYGLIFNYVNDSAFMYVGLTSHDAANWWEIGYWDGGKNRLYESEVNSSHVNVTGNWSVLKCIYNPYAGHILFKSWDNSRYEPTSWDLDITDATNFSTSDTWVDSTTQWGIYCTGRNDTVDWWGVGVADLHYDTRTNSDVTGGKAPILYPNHVRPADYAEIHDDAVGMSLLSAWNDLDQSSYLTYESETLYPKGNVYVFSAWNLSAGVLGLIIYDDNDDYNSSSDFIGICVDKNHNFELDDGDKYFEAQKNGAGCTELSYTYSTDSWVADTTCQVDANYAMGQTGFTRYMHTQWRLLINISSIIPSSYTIGEFADGAHYLGIAIWGGTPNWCWNIWNEQTNSTRCDFYNCTGGAYNKTGLEFTEEERTPSSSNLSCFGELDFVGYSLSPESDKDYLDLLDFDSGEVKIFYSAVWKAPRYLVDCDKMEDNNYTKIKVPDSYSKSLLLWSSTETVDSVIFFGITTTTYSRTDISLSGGTKSNYTVKDSQLSSYDKICVVPNPSTLDTNGYFFKWLYKDDVTS